MLLEHFTHNTRVRVPWSAIHKYPDEYISEECIPDDVTIRDPSKLLLSEVKKLWKLWRDRQKNVQCKVHTRDSQTAIYNVPGCNVV